MRQLKISTKSMNELKKYLSYRKPLSNIIQVNMKQNISCYSTMNITNHNSSERNTGIIDFDPSFTKCQSGLFYKDLVLGQGITPSFGDIVHIHYIGKLHYTGKVFDSSYSRNEPISFTLGLGQVIPGTLQLINLL